MSAVRPFRFGVQILTPAATPGWLDRARAAESLGYSVVSVPDHLFDQMSPMPALGAIAAATTTIRLGTMVLANDFRNPVLTAREAATVGDVWRSDSAPVGPQRLPAAGLDLRAVTKES